VLAEWLVFEGFSVDESCKQHHLNLLNNLPQAAAAAA
jgi:hypothetical protein